MKRFNEYKALNLPAIADEMLALWKKEGSFHQTLEARKNGKHFVFYEGPPSANGMPGIHHVIARTLKDIFCRYKTQQGYLVRRKAGWDTHGLPVELTVEKELGITKEDIGKSISIEAYNQKCREAVMRYTSEWESLTEKMGYWVDMKNPYVTYDNKYIESVWYLLKKLSDKGLLYKGYTIQPYSPKAGTGLSAHELNMPGCYKDVQDQTVVAIFKLKKDDHYNQLFGPDDVSMIAWTTTPWTLPSNTALAVGLDIDYVLVRTLNRFNGKPLNIILAKALLAQHFRPEDENLDISAFEQGGKVLPYTILKSFKGRELPGLKYEQLLPYAQPMDNPDQAFRVIPGDFVTTEDGTGIVHIAPTFGADDMRAAESAGVPPMLVPDENGNPVPLVDKQGRFHPAMGELAGKYVKNEYYPDGEAPEKSVDIEIMIRMVEEGKCFSKAKYVHNYPHCWRTDKPVLYYPLDSWFIKTTAVKDRMVELNKSIGWKPEHTGTGRFGEWLKNLHDWNLSRSRYWGVPLPVWRTEEGDESLCVGSLEELKDHCQQSVDAGLMESNPLAGFVPGDMSEENYLKFDMHRPYVDDIILQSSSGKAMYRERDLIDVWFDSGAMPYAQCHYPFEHKDFIDDRKEFPADFIAEGVDQTRGWFFTLHAIATLCFDDIAYKNVISNGLVLDKNGQKMSKRLGNAVDPFLTLKTYGADATRWYLITNAQPWDNLKFDAEGIEEVQRKFFRALQNTYAFFALYANVDGFQNKEAFIPLESRPEIDRWILSRLNSLCKEVEAFYESYEPTRAGRAIQTFVVDDLSNWYVRLCRKRFWRGEYGNDKIAAFQCLYKCLETIAGLAAPIAPFYCDRLYRDLHSFDDTQPGIHLSDFPASETAFIDKALEEKMALAQKISSLALSIRKKEKIRVRQPLQSIMVPVPDDHLKAQLKEVEPLILNEINVKNLIYLEPGNEILVRQAKPVFNKLGPRYGKQMKMISAAINQLDASDIARLESSGSFELNLDGAVIRLERDDVALFFKDIPGHKVAVDGPLTVALDIEITDVLLQEGLAREMVNRIQNIRKDQGLEVTDRIEIKVKETPLIGNAINNNLDYICSETLAGSLEMVDDLKPDTGIAVELGEEVKTIISINKI